ncbi:alpha-galactosidase [Auraticoccus sp. F435]|uniref:Alpha-galactosidase n=1 Tax=Auraticoccus cholistanensis TaxID=2656650 RepID=A0A6A9UQU5_9ACTN|nr:alpha-galactosidase [Auraticoccus cholistanensis]MVA75113.1 alpha-galactosidase [Auraticoccus cholistanensis]
MSGGRGRDGGGGGRTWTLPTASGVLVLGVDPGGCGLTTLLWGAVDAPLTVPAPVARRSAATLDPAGQEVTALGTRNRLSAEVVVRRADGLRGARLELVDGSVSVRRPDADVHQLSAELADELVGLRVRLHVRTSTAHDVVEKWAELSSTADHPLELLRAWGGAFTVRTGSPGARVRTLTGGWSREFEEHTVHLPVGTFSLGSREGITSLHAGPALVVTAAEGEETQSWACGLSWSGSWRLQVEAAPFGDGVRVSGGTDDESGIRVLAPGESLTTPVLTGLWVPGGTAEVAQAWHAYQRTLARSTGPEHRPVVYNSWYATTFDVEVGQQQRLADTAAELGAEVFVVDDGWFRGRTSDRAGLGDWDVDPAKFPRGLDELVEHVTGLGMRFGLWVEPEAVNPDSDLYRAHPDWVHRGGGRPQLPVRNQLTLDLGLPEVEEFVGAMLSRLLTEHDISYLKWDMNRPISDGGAPLPGHEDWSVRHTEAYLRIMRRLREEFPHVTVEACAAGGGRIDNAVLAVSDVIWPSDETGPRDRLLIQHGFLSAYPAWTMSSWVTHLDDVRDPDPASLEFRFVTAMAGVLGVGADLRSWDPGQVTRARELVELYREIRPVVHGGLVRRHGHPSQDAYAVQYTTDDTVVVLAWARPGRTSELVVALGDLPAGVGLRSRRGGVVEDGGRVRVGWSMGDCDVVVLDRVGDG